MQVLLTAATPFEIAPVRAVLATAFDKVSGSHYQKGHLRVEVLVTGVGIALTASTVSLALARQKYDLAINAGVAGAFNQDLKTGDVVNVVSERFGDLGVEEADGSFTDVHELGLMGKNQLPFQNGWLVNPSAAEYAFLPTCTGLTVHKVHGSQESIGAVKKKYGADIETMEGAAFFLPCLLMGIPFLEIRAISNYVEPRNRESWNLSLAIENLNKVLNDLIDTL